MNENNQNKPQASEDSLKLEKRGSNAAQSKSGMKKLLTKRWFSPALFMITAALIVTLLWVYQDKNTDQPTTGTNVTDVEEATGTGTGTGTEEVPAVNPNIEPDVAATGEDMQWPVADVSTLQVEIPFYDVEASATENEAALIQVESTFVPHMGVDFVSPEGTSFDVLAALEGVVSVVENNPINGQVIEINHGNGLVTVYQSLSEVLVQEGDEVLQGTTIAKAGRSDVERDLGVHLHFETRLNGENVNPSSYILE